MPHAAAVSTLNLDSWDACERFCLLVLVDVGSTLDRIPARTRK